MRNMVCSLCRTTRMHGEHYLFLYGVSISDIQQFAMKTGKLNDARSKHNNVVYHHASSIVRDEHRLQAHRNCRTAPCRDSCLSHGTHNCVSA